MSSQRAWHEAPLRPYAGESRALAAVHGLRHRVSGTVPGSNPCRASPLRGPDPPDPRQGTRGPGPRRGPDSLRHLGRSDSRGGRGPPAPTRQSTLPLLLVQRDPRECVHGGCEGLGAGRGPLPTSGILALPLLWPRVLAGNALGQDGRATERTRTATIAGAESDRDGNFRESETLIRRTEHGVGA